MTEEQLEFLYEHRTKVEKVLERWYGGDEGLVDWNLYPENVYVTINRPLLDHEVDWLIQQVKREK